MASTHGLSQLDAHQASSARLGYLPQPTSLANPAKKGSWVFAKRSTITSGVVVSLQAASLDSPT